MVKSKKFKNSRFHKQIKKKLIDHELTQADIARALGVSPVFIYMVVTGRRKSKRVYEYLEKKLGVKV